jgi:hypothetical protein
VFKKHPFLRALYIFACSWLILLIALSFLYFFWLRDWQMNWGATDQEIKRHMPGDELLKNPEFNTTRVVEINASPDKVWPWLVQMGINRGGFYNFDRLDHNGKPSAERIIPEFQNLKVGDSILPLLQVVEIVPQKSMLWRFLKGAGGWANATWSWGLVETEAHHTRLTSRLRQEYDSGSIMESGMYLFQEITEIFMMRTCLLGIKLRVESHEKAGHGAFSTNRRKGGNGA